MIPTIIKAIGSSLHQRMYIAGTMGTYKDDTIILDLDSSWDGMSVWLMYACVSGGQYKLKYDDGGVHIPSEIMSFVGHHAVAVYGVDPNDAGHTKTSTKSILCVVDTLPAYAVTDPTPSEIAQMEARFAQVEDFVTLKAGEAATSAGAAKVSEENAAKSAEIAVKSALSAGADAETTAKNTNLAVTAACNAATSERNASDAKNAAEKARDEIVTEEQSRQQAEQERTATETARDKSEALRAAAEQNRVKTEQSRENAEQNRVKTEQSRKNAEQSRVTEEKSRTDAETKRMSAEQLRTIAENERVEAELLRKNAYQYAVTAGYSGTEKEFYADLGKLAPTVDTADTTVITLEDNTVYHRGTLTTLSLSVPGTLPALYSSALDFTAGTNIALDYLGITWSGDDVDADGIFVPVAGRTYDIDYRAVGGTVRGRVGRV